MIVHRFDPIDDDCTACGLDATGKDEDAPAVTDHWYDTNCIACLTVGVLRQMIEENYERKN